MRCSSCGAMLPSETAAFCPTCGVLTPYDASRALPYNSTVSTSSYPGIPSTSAHDSQPSLPAVPPPPPPKPKGGKIAVIISVIALVLLLSCGGLYALIIAAARGPASPGTTTPVVTPSTQAQPTATVSAAQNLYNTATSGTPVLNDPLSTQDSHTWDEHPLVGGACAFTGGQYHASVQQQDSFLPCYAHATQFGDFVFQVQMTIIKGDEGGIVFRADSANTKLYRFGIFQDGSYSLVLYVDETGAHSRRLQSGSFSMFNAGLNQPNLVAVAAQGNNLYLYVNKQFVTSVSDSTYSSGIIGVFAEDYANPTEVVFTNAEVWNL